MEKHRIYTFGRPDTQGQFAREPVLRRMADGSLVCLFLTGGPTEPHNDNHVVISLSLDDGCTWSVPEPLFSHRGRAVWATELFVPPEGDPFAVVHTYQSECFYRELQTFRSFTRDCGRSWSEPASFPNGLNGVSLRQGIVLSNGEWLFPMYWQETLSGFDWTEGAYSAPFCTGAAISPDRGASFFRTSCYQRAELGVWEPNCVELEPGHLVLLMRCNHQYLRRADSFDYGRSWTENSLTGIPNPSTKFSLVKVRDAVLLLNNFVAAPGWESRTHLEIRVSRDGLHSFDCCLPLEPSSESWFYPHACADDSRRILYVAYENAREHRLAKIPYEELGL